VEEREKEREALEENRGRGVYPSVGKEGVCKEMKGKGIDGVPLGHNGDEGTTSD
jgi:hypothetical protein